MSTMTSAKLDPSFTSNLRWSCVCWLALSVVMIVVLFPEGGFIGFGAAVVFSLFVALQCWFVMIDVASFRERVILSRNRIVGFVCWLIWGRWVARYSYLRVNLQKPGHYKSLTANDAHTGAYSLSVMSQALIVVHVLGWAHFVLLALKFFMGDRLFHLRTQFFHEKTQAFLTTFLDFFAKTEQMIANNPIQSIIPTQIMFLIFILSTFVLILNLIRVLFVVAKLRKFDIESNERIDNFPIFLIFFSFGVISFYGGIDAAGSKFKYADAIFISENDFYVMMNIGFAFISIVTFSLSFEVIRRISQLWGK